jgi:predicted aldo/keto reductase-like oxidoreductase
LSFGCGSRFTNGYKTDEEALEILETALKGGINYFDSAHSYGEGESERRLGLFLQKHRKEVFLVTKLESRDPDEFLWQFELSLKRLQQDRVDLLHIHALENMEDLERIGAKNGIYGQLEKLKEQGGTRFIGFSCHTEGKVAQAAIERFQFDCCMLQLNASKAGGFVDTALPAALKKKMGVVAMKATGQEKLLGAGEGKAGIEDLMRYCWSLPVAAVNLGMPTMEMLKQNLQLARAFQPMQKSEVDLFEEHLTASRVALESFFRTHSDFGIA